MNILPLPIPLPIPVRKLPAHQFKYAGRWWTIRKRSLGPDAYWHLRLERQGVTQRDTLRTTSITHAELEAKAIIDKWLEGWRRPTVDTTIATLGQVFAFAPHLAIRAGPRGRNGYVWGCRWVLKRALKLADDAAVDVLSCAVLTAETGRAFFVAILAEANGLPTQGAQNRHKRTALQIFGFAKALFSTAATESMRLDGKLHLPDVAGFRAASKVGEALLKPGDASEWSPPDDAVLARTITEWEKLGNTPWYTIQK